MGSEMCIRDSIWWSVTWILGSSRAAGSAPYVPVPDLLLNWCVTKNRTQIFLPRILLDLLTLATKVPSSFAFSQRPGHGSMTSPSPDEVKECMRSPVPTAPAVPGLKGSSRREGQPARSVGSHRAHLSEDRQGARGGRRGGGIGTPWSSRRWHVSAASVARVAPRAPPRAQPAVRPAPHGRTTCAPAKRAPNNHWRRPFTTSTLEKQK